MEIDETMAGEETRRSNRRITDRLGLEVELGSVCIDLLKYGVTSVNDSVDKELLLFRFR